jgi:signal transduction histidine kinase/CheY-like chemotaxis protein
LTSKRHSRGPTNGSLSAGSTIEARQPQTRARLVALTGSEVGRVHRIAGTVLLGRDHQAQVHIDAPDVSRRHARIAPSTEGGWEIEDLGSFNGTWVNGLPVKGRQPIEFGDRLQIGGSLLLVFTHHDLLEERVAQLQKMEAMGQLAGEVAHDFKNLLTILSHNLTYMHQSAVSGVLKMGGAGGQDELYQCLEDMSTSTRRATELVQRLLDFARPGRKKDLPVDLSAVATEVMQICRRTFPESITIRQAITPELEVTGDSAQFHQALVNLCLNARDAMPEGGTLRVSVEHMALAQVGQLDLPLDVPGEYILVSVADSGVGMDEQTLARAFEPFFSTKGPKKGTGLGLSTVYGVVKAHGGHVQVESEPGQGTTFRLVLPKAGELVADSTMPGEEPLEDQQAAGRELVLLVDDHQEVRLSTGQILDNLGFDVITAVDGGEAVEIFRKHRDQLTLVLLDLVLPRISGGEAYREMAHIDPSVPVVLISGFADEREVSRLLRAGVKGFLPKPFDTEQLDRAIRLALGDGKRA